MLRKTAGTVAAVRMQFAGASAQAQITGDTEMPGKINHLNGNDPAKWRTAWPCLPKSVWMNFIPASIWFTTATNSSWNTISRLRRRKTGCHCHPFRRSGQGFHQQPGELILTLGDAEIRQPKPVIYQMVGDARHEINGGYGWWTRAPSLLLSANMTNLAIGD